MVWYRYTIKYYSITKSTGTCYNIDLTKNFFLRKRVSCKWPHIVWYYSNKMFRIRKPIETGRLVILSIFRVSEILSIELK